MAKDLRPYHYYKTPHHATVANRLYELPEVSRLQEDECVELVRKGFESHMIPL
jgi:hypothetical protein